jgi:hypothetical protein
VAENVRIVWVDVMMVAIGIGVVVALFALQDASQATTAAVLSLYMLFVIAFAFVAELAAVNAEKKNESSV